MRLTDHLCGMKNSFLPYYGWNKSRRFGRRLLREEEVIVYDKSSLETKNYIQKSLKTEEIRCIDEVSVLIECLLAHEYDSRPCAKEYERAKNCKKREIALQNRKRAQIKLDYLPENSNDLNITQINMLLKSYKLPKNTKTN